MILNNTRNILKMSPEKLYKLPEEQSYPLQFGPVARVLPEALQHEGVEYGHDKGVSVGQGFLRYFEPVLLVCPLRVYLPSQVFIMEIEGVLAEEELVHDDSQGEDIVLGVVVGLRVVVFGGGVGHGEAGVVHCVGRGVLSRSSGW